MSTLKHTPLYDAHLAAGAKLVPFAGFEMPVSYAGVIEEHTTVRERVGLFDVSHMGEFVVSGPDTWAYLDRVVTNDCSKLAAATGHAMRPWREALGQYLNSRRPEGDAR